MKAKKPLLLAVLFLALLVVAFILPAAASGQSDNKPVNWASSGENSNRVLHFMPWQGGHSILIMELGDGSIVGHGILVGVKPERAVMHAQALLDHDPFTSNPIDVFRVEGDYRVAEVIMDFGDDPALPFRYFKVVLYDGGEPGTADWESNWVGVDGFGWVLFGEDPPFSNIQVHLGE
jgi:hypothetical protein